LPKSLPHHFFIQYTSAAKLVSNIRQQPPQNLITAPSLKAPMYRFEPAGSRAGAYVQAQRDYFQDCIAKGGNMPD